jgi:2-polyprenyl-6-methoxyphenol hydroxylase-like FAD-dependent oxidoreductase
MPRSRALEDPLTRPLAEKEGHLNMFMGRDRRVVIYPTRNHELLNFVCIHPTSETQAKDQKADDWQSSANLEKMLEVYKDWDPAVLKILSMADEETLKVWDLLDMDQLPTWTKDRLALIGDAAHPFTPREYSQDIDF